MIKEQKDKKKREGYNTFQQFKREKKNGKSLTCLTRWHKWTSGSRDLSKKRSEKRRELERNWKKWRENEVLEEREAGAGFVKKQRASRSLMLREPAFLTSGILMIHADNFEPHLTILTLMLLVQESTKSDTEIERDFAMPEE